ncbi:ankyrin repeat-containing domain protein [Schizophyllum commune]
MDGHDSQGRSIHLKLAKIVFENNDLVGSMMILKKFGVNLGAVDRDGRTLLHHLVTPSYKGEYTWLDSMARILDTGLAENTFNNPPSSSFKMHCPANTRMLGFNADPNVTDAQGRTPLWHVFYDDNGHGRKYRLNSPAGRLTLARILISQGAAVDLDSQGGVTLLHDAIKRGDAPEIVEFLLTSIPSLISAQDNDGDTPLHEAIRRFPRGAPGGARHILALLNAGANVNARETLEGLTPLHLIIQLLIKDDTDDETQLYPLARQLIELGADINSPDKQGRTLLHAVVQRCDNGRLVDFLISEGININAGDLAGRTALHIACHGARKRWVLNVLIRAGAKTSIRDSAGNLPSLPFWAVALAETMQTLRTEEILPIIVPPSTPTVGTTIPMSCFSYAPLSTSKPRPLSAREVGMGGLENRSPALPRGSLADEQTGDRDTTTEDHLSMMNIDRRSSKDEQPPRVMTIDWLVSESVATQPGRSEKRAREDDDDRPPMSPGERARREGAFEDSRNQW